MTALTKIVRKELRELLTPSVILPVVIMARLFGSLGSAIGDIAGQAQAKPTIGVVPMDQGVLGNVSLHVLEAGADLVFGHSCHVFRGIELYRGRPILYGAGTSSMITPWTKSSGTTSRSSPLWR